MHACVCACTHTQMHIAYIASICAHTRECISHVSIHWLLKCNVYDIQTAYTALRYTGSPPVGGTIAQVAAVRMEVAILRLQAASQQFVS